MTDNVFWLVELDIHEGKTDDFKAVMKAMVEWNRADEPGTLNYEWYISEDGKQCHIYERYANSAAAMVHLGNFGEKFAKQFDAVCTPTRLMVYGDASPDLTAAVAGIGASHFSQIGGFER